MAVRIRLIATGGTIAEASSGAEGQHRTGNNLLAAIGLLPGIDIEPVDLLEVPSTFIGLPEMRQVACAVSAAFEEGFDGVVVTHGTDTLEETAYFVDAVVHERIPVVFTGAMLLPEVPGADGPFNLRNALFAAAHKDCADLGVLVTLAGELHAAREVIKLHTMSLAAFKSPEFGPLGTVDDGRVYVSRRLTREPPLPLPAEFVPVELVKCHAGMSDLHIRAATEARCAGLVIEAFGSGQVPPAIIPAIKDAVATGVMVVAAPRAPTGRLVRSHVSQLTPTAGDERDLLEAGVLFTDLQGPKARIRLALALSTGLRGDALRGLFQHPPTAESGTGTVRESS